MRKLLLIVTALVLAPINHATATVYEFGTNGQVAAYEAVDYLSKTRHSTKVSFSYGNHIPEKRYKKYVAAAAKKYGVDQDLIHAVIYTESAYRSDAVSPKGAEGLMQLMPATAKRFGVTDSFDAEQNINGGTQYLSWLSKEFDGDRTLILAAYNAGENAVNKYNGVPPYRETENYIAKVEATLLNF